MTKLSGAKTFDEFWGECQELHAESHDAHRARDRSSTAIVMLALAVAHARTRGTVVDCDRDACARGRATRARGTARRYVIARLSHRISGEGGLYRIPLTDDSEITSCSRSSVASACGARVGALDTALVS